MTNRNIQLTGPPLNDQQLYEFERIFQAPLPSDYRQFLLSHNGGFVTGTDWPTPDQGIVTVTWRQSSRAKTKPEAVFAGQFPKLIGGETDFDSVTYDIRSLGRVPAPGTLPVGLIPIGRDPAGLFFLLMTRGTYAGHIFLWDRSFIPQITIDDLGYVAPGFGELIQSLQAEPADWDQFYASLGERVDPRDKKTEP